MTKERKSPLFALGLLAALVVALAARSIHTKEYPSVFEVCFAGVAVRLFYERSDEAMDIAIRMIDRED